MRPSKKTSALKSTVKPWSSLDLLLHKKAVRLLENILKQAILEIQRRHSISEEQLYHFIIARMQSSGLSSMLGWTIVAYGHSAAQPHYAFTPGKSRMIKRGHFLLLDIWGKINRPDAPYADITHMYFVGKNPPNRFTKLWLDLRAARDKTLACISTSCLTRGATLHNIARRCLDRCGHSGLFIHGLGHDLGHDHVHGPGANLSPRFKYPLIPGRGYTIEPGIYKKGHFGLRSEINFFFDRRRNVRVTTRLQKELECIF